MTSLYLHIPFCKSKCGYCAYSSSAGLAPIYSRYCNALRQEITSTCLDVQGTELKSLYIGGGTPSVVGAESLISLIDTVTTMYQTSEDTEITIEVNPATITPADLTRLRSRGVNRLSVGIQSFHDDELQLLGRTHDAAAGEAVVAEARRAGFTNIGIDLMYGIPGQSPQSWRITLERALEAEPQHLSLYQLMLEQGTDIGKKIKSNSLILPSDEEVEQMDAAGLEFSRSGGLRRYEIANFAVPGYVCAHNLVYWRNDEYLACGASAVSSINGLRSNRIADPVSYCERIERGESVLAEQELLEWRASFRETVVMGLRLIEGVSESRLIARYNLSLDDMYGPLLASLAAQGLIERGESSIRLTPHGLRFADMVMAQLV